MHAIETLNYPNITISACKLLDEINIIRTKLSNIYCKQSYEINYELLNEYNKLAFEFNSNFSDIIIIDENVQNFPMQLSSIEIITIEDSATVLKNKLSYGDI